MSVTLIVRNRKAASSAPSTLTFDQPRIVIGRGAHADVRLPSRRVSETHAVIRLEAGDLSVTDEASTNGTRVNDQPLVRGRKKALRKGDSLTIAEFEIELEPALTRPDPADRTASVARKLLVEVLPREDALASVELLTGKRAGSRFVIAEPGERLVAGRGDRCDVLLDDPDCSRQHAEFVRDEHGVLVRDLGSKNGVLVGGRAVHERRLRDGDEVQLGRSVVRYCDAAEELLRALEHGGDEAVPDEQRSAALSPSGARVDATGGPERSPSDALRSDQRATRSTRATGSAAPDRGAPTLPPPGLQSPLPGLSPARASPRADWVVALLALVILASSAFALYFVLHGTPAAVR